MSPYSQPRGKAVSDGSLASQQRPRPPPADCPAPPAVVKPQNLGAGDGRWLHSPSGLAGGRPEVQGPVVGDKAPLRKHPAPHAEVLVNGCKPRHGPRPVRP